MCYLGKFTLPRWLSPTDDDQECVREIALVNDKDEMVKSMFRKYIGNYRITLEFVFLNSILELSFLIACNLFIFMISKSDVNYHKILTVAFYSFFYRSN